MAKAIFTVFFKIIKAMANVILAPVNLLVANLFPNFGALITAFNQGVNMYLGNGLAFFLNFLPPSSRNLILLWVLFLISYYSISLSIHAILKVYKLIKQIKIW